jgi:uncharacterized protein involved in exopolysaccharide biosynthesis
LLTARVRRAAFVLAAGAILMVVAVSCQSPAKDEDRISKLESSVATVSSIATRVNALEGKDQGVEGQVAALSQSIAGLQASIEDLRKDLGGAQGADASLKKKVDSMAAQVAQAATAAGKIGSIEQKITLLETRYNDHLRKYHGG